MPSAPTTSFENPFVEWLQAEIDRRGWTMAELARRAGVFQSVIGGIVTRRRDMSPETGRKIAKALGMSQHKLFVIAGIIDDEESADDAILVEIARSLARMDAVARRRLVRLAEVLAEDLESLPDGHMAPGRPGRQAPAKR